MKEICYASCLSFEKAANIIEIIDEIGPHHDPNLSRAQDV